MNPILLNIIIAVIFLIIGGILGWLCAPHECGECELDLRQLKTPTSPRSVPMFEQISIVVNGRPTPVNKPEISYAEVIAFAGWNNPERVLSVTYWVRKKPGSDSERSGLMHRGCKPVRVEPGMFFTVADTSNA